MKKIFNAGIYSTPVSSALLIIRVTVGILMLTHGYAKLLLLFGDAPVQFADPIGLGASTSFALVVFAEFICSIFLIFGIATRFATIPLIITMMVAVFIAHGNDPFVRKELPLLYSGIFIAITIAGAGKFSLDHWMSKKMR